ncbi:unnamed protein product [Paramecium pentaurelia]|uniref:Uncharacterized protein n=1 Tax=Paramecium pentaurelia TaxID=43138 RepID=A0A8S1VHT4_9CILI|nr:unnamed protein product [Paramecium pentaurelia]
MILIIEGQPLMKKYKISNSNRQPTRSIGVSRISTIPEIRDEQPQKKELKHNVISLKELVRKNVERKMLNTPEPHLKRKIIIPEVSQQEYKSQTTPSICKQRVIHLYAKRKLYLKSFNISLSSLKLS